jgi:uncharacterized protein YyaL (SSP411 family)
VIEGPNMEGQEYPIFARGRKWARPTPPGRGAIRSAVICGRMSKLPSAPTNRLGAETSPYLLLHAANPVDWYPWGDEAFEKAAKEGKPVFLSVGYSTCYWCHVMERESFSDPDIARQLNDGFVSIKLDREERPELDEFFMTATQLLTHQGGWPNSLFLTPGRKPFFAGTYFPPIDTPGRPGFPRVLASVQNAWVERRDAVLEQADAVVKAIQENLAGGSGVPVLPGPAVVAATQAMLARRFDPDFGGFGGAPKFPSPSNLFFLLERSRIGSQESTDMLVQTLEGMARGGIHDQLGGGFHRYSTDAEWLVPHFEKMLYDNACLATLYAEAASIAPQAGFERVARRTLAFVLSELRSPEGPFLSAIDAETDGDEGAYYVWTREDLRDGLGPQDDAFLAQVFGYDGRPNFEGARYVLHLPKGIAERAELLGMTLEALLSRIEPLGAKLLDVRFRRPRPLVDDKILTDWNGLMIATMARAEQILGDPSYLRAAVEAVEFILERLRDPSTGRLLHVYRAGAAKVPAMLDDYAFLVSALLRIHEATKGARWLEEAQRLMGEQGDRLEDQTHGGYFAAGEESTLPFRAKTGSDAAYPSGNGVSALNCLDLGRLTGEERYTQKAGRLLESFGAAISAFPLGHLTLVQAVARISPLAELVAAPSSQESHDPVEVEGSLVAAKAPGAWPTFRIEMRILEGWHVNAHPASFATLVGTDVQEWRGRIRGARYPPGEVLGHLPSGESIRVYRGHVTIEGEIDPLAGETPGVRVVYQACDEARCLAPTTLEVNLT